MERARRGNPTLAAGDAQITAAAAGRELADRSWYPDITLGAAAIDRSGNGPPGYMASIGLKVPLQWGLHDAQQREASATLSAAQARRHASALQVQGELGEIVASLVGSRKT